MTLGDRVESDGRVSITTGYSSRLNIGSGVYFNDGAVISCLGKITIGENTLYGPGVKIFDNNHRFSREEGVSRACAAGCITVGRSCWSASDVVLLKGTDIGDNCVIGAGSVVLKNLPANCTAVGVPAEVVRINNKAINPADDLDQQDLPDIMAQRLIDLDRRIGQLEKAAQGDIPPTAQQVAARQRKH